MPNTKAGHMEHCACTRRSFLAAAGGAAVAGVAHSAQRPRPALTARPFPLTAVRLLPGSFLTSLEWNRQYMHRLETDRLLHTFKLNAGLSTAAKPLGGWETPDIEIRGHFTGHYLSACALMSNAVGDRELRARGDAVVASLAECQKKLGGGYISAFPVEFFDRLKAGKQVWVPWYTVHKIFAGLLDMYTLAGNREALAVAEGMGQWTKRWLDPLSDQEMAGVMRTEFGGMNDVLFELYRLTGNEDYAAAARRFDHKAVLDPLATGRDELRGLHVNTQIPKIIGMANAFETTGDERGRRIAEFFWSQAAEHRSYCTGGVSNLELWRKGPDDLAGELSDRTQECCCTYNMLKLTRRLFTWTADPRYADYYERALFNGILGTITPDEGTTMYFVPLAGGYWKIFGRPYDSFWCCTGSGVESFSKLADSIYFHDDAGIWVNLFVPSEVDWAERKLRLRQQTRFPDEGSSTITVAEGKGSLDLRLRVPQWAGSGYKVRVNGKPFEGAARPGSYVSIRREWKTGDKVEIEFPMELRAEALRGDASQQAVMYGPIVLAGDLGSEGLTQDLHRGTLDEKVKNHFLRGQPAPLPRLGTGDPSKWIRREDGQQLRFVATGAQRTPFVPLSRIADQRYAVYWPVSG